jgi:phenylacetate-CoA ligase
MGHCTKLVPKRLLFGKEFISFSKIIKDSQFYNIENHSEEIKDKIQRTLINAFTNSGHYSDKFHNIGINDHSLITKNNSIEILKRLPFIDKSGIKKNQDIILAKNKFILKDYVSTGGTSGAPFYFYINSNRSSIEWAFMMDQWSRVGFNLNSRRASFRGLRIDKLYEDDVLLKERRFSSFRLSDNYLNDIWPKLLEYKPDFIYAYPSAAYIVAKFVDNKKVQTPDSLKGILIGSENIYTSQRDYIEKVFGVKTFAWYGHSEKLVLAGECEYDRIYHAYPQYGYVEFITKEGKHAKPGEFAEIVGTGFINTVMPFIRYKTGDWCTYLGESCPKCGRNYPVFKDVQGRWTQEILVGIEGNLISMSAINVHSVEFEKVIKFQYYQDKPGKAVLKLVPNSSFGKNDLIKINDLIQKKLKGTVELKTILVDDIPLTVGGKFKFIDQKIDIKNI